MDDLFVKFDKKRLKKQIEILRKINEEGWQGICFRAKNKLRSKFPFIEKFEKIDLILAF